MNRLSACALDTKKNKGGYHNEEQKSFSQKVGFKQGHRRQSQHR